MFHELLSRDREDGLATGQPQGVGLGGAASVPAQIVAFTTLWGLVLDPVGRASVPASRLFRPTRGSAPPILGQEIDPRAPGRTAISAVAASDF